MALSISLWCGSACSCLSLHNCVCVCVCVCVCDGGYESPNTTTALLESKPKTLSNAPRPTKKKDFLRNHLYNFPECHAIEGVWRFEAEGHSPGSGSDWPGP